MFTMILLVIVWSTLKIWLGASNKIVSLLTLELLSLIFVLMFSVWSNFSDSFLMLIFFLTIFMVVDSVLGLSILIFNGRLSSTLFSSGLENF